MAPLTASIDILTHVDGSAVIESHDTKVICSVTGPIEPKPRQELPTQLALEIIVKPAKGVSNTREKLIEDKLRAVITPLIARYLYPRRLCQITFQIMEAGESEIEFSQRELSCCINAAILALVDSGIGLLSMGSSVSLAIINGTLVVDPSGKELQRSESVHTLALEITGNGKNVKNVLLLDSTGSFKQDQLFEILSQGEDHCLKVMQELREILRNKINSEIIRSTT